MAKAYKGIGMEGVIASWYARNTKGDSRGYGRIARAVAAQLRPGSRVLEVAPGPGYLAIELAKLGDFRVCGLDISRSFVRMARENARAAGVAVDFRLGDAAHLPFGDGEFDFVLCRAAFKNFADPLGALQEMHRVLAPGGKASIFDLRRDASREAIEREVAAMQLSPWNRWLTNWTFRHMLLKRAYGDDELVRMCAQSRFGKGEIRDDGIGFELRLAR
ncbi:MAG TPA: class I SAM-dependent methyltransferase [Myxococcota bacterium]|nr:class I SAM-dependent methyltransferase [Myxococcota bacterium]